MRRSALRTRRDEGRTILVDLDYSTLPVDEEEQLSAPLNPFIPDIRPKVKNLHFPPCQRERRHAHRFAVVGDPLNDRRIEGAEVDFATAWRDICAADSTSDDAPRWDRASSADLHSQGVDDNEKVASCRQSDPNLCRSFIDAAKSAYPRSPFGAMGGRRRDVGPGWDKEPRADPWRHASPNSRRICLDMNHDGTAAVTMAESARQATAEDFVDYEAGNCCGDEKRDLTHQFGRYGETISLAKRAITLSLVHG